VFLLVLLGFLLNFLLATTSELSGVELSELFLATNGVKQGGVLSPILFCVYIDGLLMLLSKAGLGRFLGCNFFGALT
jgi:hypothetical protein